MNLHPISHLFQLPLSRRQIIFFSPGVPIVNALILS